MSCDIEQLRHKYDKEAWKNFLIAEKCIMESRFKPNSPEFQEYIKMFGRPYYKMEESYQALPVREPQRRLADPGGNKVGSSEVGPACLPYSCTPTRIP